MPDEISHLQIGLLLFDGVDQLDLTGPFEILANVPNSTCRIYAATADPVRDLKGLLLTPDALLADAPQLDVLHVPGGPGQEAVMDDEAVLAWIRRQSEGARLVLSVCTGALICGAAGLLEGRRATTHWTARHLLPIFGAEAVDARLVEDGNMIFTAGVTSGIDGALLAVARLRGERVAEAIQLAVEYAPEPPFDAGRPKTAPDSVLAQVEKASADLTQRREATAKRLADTRKIGPFA